ncbi:MAG: R3H domain protein [Firmicutes bacterium ADurb.Bin373]|nr:protein jag [Bacillota bacterium]OQA09169.1 MAG: R3H domain protein [Firmicutes bacterium ADurb.Bin373]
MKFIEEIGKTIDEAVDKALKELDATRDEVEVDVLEEPSRGIFGLIKVRPARVKVTLKDNPLKKASGLLKSIFQTMDLDIKINISENDKTMFINLEGTDLGILIGRRGETLDALQYLLNLAVNKNQEIRKKIIIDIEGYRDRREKTLQRLAIKLADKARQRGRNVVLEPMSSQERRIIHTALQGRDDIYTFSEGDEPYRKIIISPKK